VTIERVQMPLSNEELRHMGFTIGIADSADGYREDPCKHPSLNQSIAKVLATKTELHAWQEHPRFGNTKRASTDSMDDGTITDQMLLGGDSKVVVVDAENYTTKLARAARDAAKAAGKIPVIAKKMPALQERADRMRARLELAGIDFSRGMTQVPMYWVEYADDWTPVQCRGLLDSLEGLRIRDLKQTTSLAGRDIGRTIERLGYDIQCAAYRSGLERCVQDAFGRVTFEWVFVEDSMPHCVRLVRPAGSMLELGRARWRYAINTWARCINSGMWPGYEEQEVLYVEASAWALEEAARLEIDNEVAA